MMRHVVLIGASVLALMQASAEAKAQTVKYAYDARGRLVEVHHTGSPNKGLKTSYVLDKADNRQTLSTNRSWTLNSSLAGDFNGDRVDDILWRSNDGWVTDWLGNGSGQFSGNWPNSAINQPLQWRIIGVGDFNGDGRSDVLWRSADAWVTNWLGTANGGFAGNWSNAQLPQQLDWEAVGIGDFNGDKIDDVLWRNSEGWVTDWLGTTTGSFQSNWSIAAVQVTTAWHVAGAGDFNGDGRTDILWRHDSGAVTNWLGQPNGSFAGNFNAFNVTVDVAWRVVGFSDFNGDGRTDVVWRHDNGDLVTWLGQANGSLLQNSNCAYNVPTAERVVGTGDFNGDGRGDLLWRNATGAIWYSPALATGCFDTTPVGYNELGTEWAVEPR
jgi:YD repeat-containing protein